MNLRIANDLNTSFHESTPKTRQEFDVYVKYLMAKFITFEVIIDMFYIMFLTSLTHLSPRFLLFIVRVKASMVISSKVWLEN